MRPAAAVPAARRWPGWTPTRSRDGSAQLPPVDRVDGDPRWPDTLVVAVVGADAGGAVVPTGKQFVLVDGDGRGRTTRCASAPGRLPLVRLAAPGPDDPATRAALPVLGALTAELRDSWSTLVVDGARPDPAASCADGRVDHLGRRDGERHEGEGGDALLARDGKTIDVSAPEVVDRSSGSETRA